MTAPDQDDVSPDIRARIVAVAAELVAEGGAAAATTRAIAKAAGVQPPAIYRLFGDKHRLLDVVAEAVLVAFVADKASRTSDPDPVVDLARGWNTYVSFGLAHPDVFAILHAPGAASPAMVAGLDVLRARVSRVARAGRLRASVEQATELLHATGVGVVLSLLSKAPDDREGLNDVARNAVFAAILTESGADEGNTGNTGPAALASGLRASLTDLTNLSAGERGLMDELLKRIADNK